MKKFFFFLLPLVITALCCLGEFSHLKAQTYSWYVSLCKSDFVSDGHYGKCVGCRENKLLTTYKARICTDCYLKTDMYLKGNCYLCSDKFAGGGSALLCRDCARKDQCVACGKYLGSGDVPYEAGDDSKVVERYTVKVYVPGQKNEFKKYFNAGAEAYKNHNYEESIMYFKKCDEIIPNGTAYNIGISLRALKRYEEAIQYFDVSIKEDPNYNGSYYQKALVLYDLKKHSEAETLFKKAIDLNIEEPLAYFSYAFYREYYHQDAEQAIKYYEHAFKLAPDEINFRVNLIDLYQQVGKFDDALRHANVLCKLLNNSVEALNKKAEILFKAQKWNDVIPIYEKLISLDPNDIDSAYKLGLAQFQLGQFGKARDNWKKYIELDINKNPHAYSCLAVCEMKLNNPVEAEKYCVRTLELLKDENPFVYYNLACAYSLLKKVDKSLDLLEKALKTGQVNMPYMESDADFTNVRTTKKYKELVDKYRSSNLIGTNVAENKKEEPKEQKKEEAVDQKMEMIIEEPVTILVNENFNGNETDFGLNDYWKLKNGMLVCSNGEEETIHKTRISDAFQDCTIKVNARWDGRAKNAGFGIQFGFSSDEYYIFRITGDKNYQFSHWDGSEWNDIVSWTEFNFIMGGFNELKVTCYGENIRAYINNQLVVNTKVDSFSGGYSGLACSGNVDASFDNFIVTK